MTRRGFAISIPLVVVLFAFLTVVAFFQLFRTSTSLHQAARDAGGAVAESAAQSALEEALWRFQTEVNDPESDLFRKVRRALIEGVLPELDLSEDLRGRLFSSLLEKSKHKGFYDRLELQEFQAILRIPQRQDVLEAEADGENAVLPGEQFLDLTCAYSMDLQGLEIYRQIYLRRRFGITFLSPYKPFDGMTFAIVEYDFLETYPAFVMQVFDFLRSLDRIGSFLRTLELATEQEGAGRRFQARLGLLPLGEPPAGFERLNLRPRLAARRNRAARVPGWEQIPNRLVAFDRRIEDGVEARNLTWMRIRSETLLRAVPAPGQVIYSKAKRVRLEDFDHAVRVDRNVRPLLEGLEPVVQSWNQLLFDWSQDEDPLDASDLAELGRELKELRTQVQATIPTLVARLNEITQHLNQHSSTGFTRGSLEAYLNTASRRLKNLAYHTENEAQLTKLREKLEVFNGHLMVNSTQPFDLAQREWRGKTLFSAPWREDPVPFSLSRFQLADRRRDLALFNFDQLNLGGGRIEASLFVHRRAVFEGSPRIFGNLILHRLRDRQDRSSDEDLRGQVEYDPRLNSGQFQSRLRDQELRAKGIPPKLSLAHFSVGVCPRSQQKAIFRTPSGAARALEGEP